MEYDQLLSTTSGKGLQRDVETLRTDLGRPLNNLLRRFSASDFALIAPHLAQRGESQ
jgi:hypothetical protein